MMIVSNSKRVHITVQCVVCVRGVLGFIVYTHIIVMYVMYDDMSRKNCIKPKRDRIGPYIIIMIYECD